MTKYETGKIYKEFITNNEGIIASLNHEALTLKFLWKNPDSHIVDCMLQEPFFQLYFKNDIMFLLIKFNELKWVDIPCFFTKNTKNLFYFESDNLPCKILLANSNTGKLFLNQTYFMPKGISKAFVQGVHTQKDISKKTVIEKINTIRSSYSASEMSRLSLGNSK